ncbi:MAG TPA: D-alanyl-D-alanine carboxypeptidase/D-alanyl-D-alanine-endopeptidase [Gaiellaceae bacterium]|nr:D-alanyl-D-alanine carboxypeptidase/D-alanyl-D-alanine-endopeptidase [Gaiellaceae bacterium]
MRLRGLAAVCTVALAAAAAAQATAPSTAGRLGRALRVPGVDPAASAAAVVDLATGEEVFSRNAGLSLAPASNEKLAVAYTALVELGPGYRFATSVLAEGRQAGSVWRGRLVLKGFGDPTLQTDDLKRLARRLHERGIRRVTGHVAGDGSWFDDRWTAPGWRPGFYGLESPPLSALVVNRGVRHRRLVRDPRLAAAALFDRILREQGIDARDAVVGAARPGAVTLATVRSKKLANLLRSMDADSDNFTAELVLKAIGAKVQGVGSTAAGAAVVRRDLAAAGIPLAGVRIVDGSGLSSLDRATARELAALLYLCWRTPSLRALVPASLAVAGETGTLRHRLLGPGTRGIVRGKTGTTALASALSGYVGTRFAFVLLQNGHPVDWGAAHALQDRFVETLARLQKRL